MEGVGGLRLGGSPWPRWKSGTHITMEEGPVGPWGGVGPQETQGWAAPAFLSLANFPHVLWPPPALPHSPQFLLGPLGPQLPRDLSHPFCHSTDTQGVLARSSGRAGRAWASSQCPAEWAWYT